MKKLFLTAFLVGILGVMALPVHAAAGGGEEEEAPAASRSGFEFVSLDPLILPIIDKNGISQTLSIVVSIEVTRTSHADRVRTLKPRLQDAFIQEMYGVLNRHAAYKGGLLQVQMLKERLGKISRRVLGDDIVSDVLLQVVQQRQL